MARHRARQQALQLLFQWDVRRTPPDEILRGYYESLLIDEENAEASVARPRRDAYAETLFRGVMEESAPIDEIITRHAANWRIPRMPTVDRNLLRIAVYEMMHADTPPAVAIDEAIELARRFSGEESAHFVNGVLDAVRRDLAETARAGS